MNDDELMKVLGETARSRRGGDLDPRWDALAAGELDAEALAELERDAAEAGDDALLEALAPMSDDDHAVFAAAALAASGPREREQGPAEPRRVEPRRAPRARSWALGAAGALAVAAALWLVVIPAPHELPEYTLDVRGGARAERAASAEVGGLRADDRVVLTLRPSDAASRPVRAALFVRTPEGDRALDVPVEIAPTGAVRVDVRAGEIAAEPGEWTLVLVVAPEGALPAPGAEGAQAHVAVIERVAD